MRAAATTGNAEQVGESGGKGLGSWALVAWWVLLCVCVLYGSFALFMGFQEALSWLGLAEPEKPRGAPVAFAIHALAGGIALLSGPLQMSRRLFARAPEAHQRTGYAYVLAVWIAAPTAVWSALSFQVVWASRILFGMVAVLWMGCTGAALLRIWGGDVTGHREWTLRSFSLTLFFVTFSMWEPLLATTELPEGIAHPSGVFLSWALNLGVAEAWIRIRRARGGSGASSAFDGEDSVTFMSE